MSSPLIPLQGNLRIMSATKRYEQNTVKMDVTFEYLVNTVVLSYISRTWEISAADEPFEKAEELILAELAGPQI